jgi:DnaJ-class molecular chaperone
MNKKIFNPEKYGMAACQHCNSNGYIQNPKRQCCPKCGGFGFIKKEPKQDTNISTRNQ